VTAGVLLAPCTLAQVDDLSAARAYEAELLADASSRTSLLAAAAGGGWEKGKFFIGDGEANTMNIGGTLQTRYLVNIRDEAAGDPEDFTSGFQVRRTRLRVSGTVWDKNLSYSLQGDFSRSSGTFTLLDAEGRYKFDNGMFVRWGQYKVPLLREELVGDHYQLAVERSTVNAVFTQERSQGVGLGYARGQFRVAGDLSDGLATVNTDFDSAKEADIAGTIRADWFWGTEDVKRFDDFTSFRGSGYAGLAGAAIHYQSSGETGGGAADVDIIQATADISIEGNGWNAFVAGVWRNMETPAADADDFGFIAQAGVFASDQVEFFGRFDAVVPDDTGGADSFNTITAGVNYYVSPTSHAFQLSADVLYYLDAQASAGIVPASTGSNLLADTEEGQVALRIQAQIIF